MGEEEVVEEVVVEEEMYNNYIPGCENVAGRWIHPPRARSDALDPCGRTKKSETVYF